MWSVRNYFLCCSAHLLELCHQVLLSVEAAGRIDDHVVGTARLGGAQAIEEHCRRIAAWFGLDDLHSRAIAPNF